uniref:HNH endonuclease n=1 Tax=Clostridium sp. TaxID=1506 RepID=UPI0030788B7B
ILRSRQNVFQNKQLIEKGYLNEDELIQQYNLSKYISLIKDKTIENGDVYFERHFDEILKFGEIKEHKYEIKLFEDRKENQINFMMRAISDYPGIRRRDHAVEIISLSEDWKTEDRKSNSTKRDPIAHQIYRNYLLNESVSVYDAEVCYADKRGWKALVASHIVPFNECEGLGHKEWQYDRDNGLLLSPNIDAYFDKFDISFDINGNIMLPNEDDIVKPEIKEIISSYKLDAEILNDRRKVHLNFHKERFLKKHPLKRN